MDVATYLLSKKYSDSIISNKLVHRYTIGVKGDFQTIQAAITWLGTGLNMTDTTELLVDVGIFPIVDTIAINLTHAITFRGLSFSGTIFSASTGLANKPMFSITSAVSFENVSFLGIGLANWGTQSTENFINIIGTQYHEFKGVFMNTCYSAFSVTGNASIFIFNGVIKNCIGSGIEMNSIGTSALDVEITTLENCAIGVNLLKSSAGLFNISSVVFINSLAQICIQYTPINYIYTNHPVITANTWNNVGTFLSGFDFSRADGRDANIYVRSNCGGEDKIPHCKVNVVNNVTTTTITTGGTFYKANFTNGTSYACKFTLANNRYTFQSTNRSDVIVWISGNVLCNQNNRNIDVALRINGVATQISPMTVRTTTQNQAYSFALIAYLQDFVAGNYFEIFVTSPTSADLVTIQDLTIFAKGM